MSLLDAFVIVSRPIKEIFHVNSEAITLKSQFHPGVEIAIQPDTFDQDTQVILEVIIKGKCSNSIGLKNGCFVDFSAIVYHHCLHFLFMRRHGFIANDIIFFVITKASLIIHITIVRILNRGVPTLYRNHNAQFLCSNTSNIET